MCQLKSAIVLKDRVYMPDHDHHQQMLEELGIKDTSGNPDFVRVELLPPGGDVFADVESWQLSVDQDFRPDWFFEELELPKIRDCAKAWAKEHIFVDTADLDLKKGSTYYLRNCKNATLYDNCTAILYDNSTAIMRNNSTAILWNNSTATLWDNSTAIMRNNSTAILWNNSTATLRNNCTATLRNNCTAILWNNSTAILYDNSTGIMAHSLFCAKRENFVLMDNSTLKDCNTKTIYQAGDWKLVAING